MIGQFFNDLKKGENLDLYVTLTLAILLAILKPVLALFGINIAPNAIASLTLSVLAAITIVLLVNRKRMDSLEQRLLQQTRSEIVTAFPESYVTDLGRARKILQTGIHLASNLNDYHDQYELILQSGATIRFLIVAPDGNALKMTALRFAGGTSRAGQEQARIQSSLNVIAGLMEEYPGRIELRVIDYLLDESGLLIELPNGKEILYLERYTFRHSGGSMKPKFIYTPDNPWFQFVKKEMEELWKAGKPYGIERRTGA
jgi:hypothetical protein